MRNIHKSTPPSFRRRENAAAIVKAPPPGALTKGSDRKFPGLHPPLGGATSPSLPTNRRFAFPILALLAALAVGLLFLLPGGLLQAQDDGTIEYAENGTDPVATYTGIDPEGRPVHWSLGPAINSGDVATEDFADAGGFTISSDGVLSFKFPPDFETPVSSTSDGTFAARNVYKIVVVASDDAPGAETPLNSIKVAYHKVTVTVTDVDEDGSISLSAQQPQVQEAGEGEVFTATLTDQDARSGESPITNATWKWEQGTAMNGPWSLIAGAGAGDIDAEVGTKASDGYQPAADTVGKYLRATVTYTDKHGDDKTAMAVSAHAVRAVPTGTNSAPTFMPAAVSRSIDENSPPGTKVGKPVTAVDTPGDILTYMLTGEGADDANYRIDPATGQITVGPRTMLDPDVSEEAEQDTVQVTATDPSGEATELVATVTITVKNVNEAPTINGGPTKITLDEDSTEIDLDTSATDVQPPTYMATDQETTASDGSCTSDSLGSTCAWSLRGADAGDFSIASGGMLSFKKAPNFESPADADMDNMYMVTVVATDSGTPKMTATRDVVITVTNADDDGEVTLSSVQPKVGIDFTATLADPDGGVKDVKWQWASADIADISDADCRTEDAAYTWTDIAKAKSDTYTPVAANVVDTADCLRATATYTDNHASGKSAMAVSGNTVVEDRENRAPVFRDGGVAAGKVITSDTRRIAENSASGDGVGVAVVAIDPNAEEALTYTLGGSDKSSFDIDPTDGQITVGAGTKLNYEVKKVYRVTVTATDSSQASATIAITINVTDMDEAPVIAGDDIVKEFRENLASTVQTFRATDPEGRPVYWSLSADSIADNEDADGFSISSTGALSFVTPPTSRIRLIPVRTTATR